MDRQPEKRDDGARTTQAQKRRLPKETNGKMCGYGRHSLFHYVITLLLCYNNCGKNEAECILAAMHFNAHILLSRLDGDDCYERVHW